MLEGVTVDQLRMFIAAAELQSFSAAGRRLNRAQSVISQAIATLEGQLGVTLFTRTGRFPELTEQGKLLLADAKAVTASLAALKARAKGMAAGLEPELAVAIDVMFPMSLLTRAAAAFGEHFPTTPLRLYVEALGGVAKAVLEGQCGLGIMGSLPLSSPSLVTERLLPVQIVFVAAPGHPLAQLGRGITAEDLAAHVQLVLTDRTDLSKGREFSVMSPRSWRLADMGAKHAFLLAGLGWGGMPLEMVARDLREGALVELTLLDTSPRVQMAMSAAYRADAPPGPAGRWFVEQLKHHAGRQDRPG
ncbi:LysR family transcriptional regulator [Acidocella sp. KAb 2-4]|uniref:LysR family transcriptional regulator n=1 Tax=Acidocella sp. KAb 2-4 TaxID=2885158 RepID=UPI001D05F99B|nr:LysR family transcriptional regulator [Acidocella sp. KAb 2-4]MCB5943869.1 LysR family transcriptional regulator [Acidocella sp. KAb 2-4]